MATTNQLFQVLVSTGNLAPLAKGSRESALAVGQLGIFNYHTGLSVDATSLAGEVKDVYISVGLNKLGSGGGATLEDINRSAGQMIQARNAKSYTIEGYLAAVPKIVSVDGISSARCESTYTIKVEFKNSKVFALNGFNQFTKTYPFTTGCCADQCSDCGSSDVAALMIGLAAVINADLDQLVTASFYSTKILFTVTAGASASASLIITIGTTVYTVPVLNTDTVSIVAGKIVAQINSQAASPYRASNIAGAITINAVKTTTGSTDTVVLTSAAGTGVTIGTIVAAAKSAVADATAAAAFQLAYPGAGLGLTLTSNPLAVGSFSSGVNVEYNKMRVTNLVVTLVSLDARDGFNCAAGVVTTVQEMAEEQGEGYDLQQLEYVAGGWNGKPGPYRQSVSTGLARKGYEYYAVKGSKYNVLSITYDQNSVGGWEEFLNNLETIIAIPCANTVTLIGLVATLDFILTQFAPHTNDVAAMACVNTEVHTINNHALDGVESLG